MSMRVIFGGKIFVVEYWTMNILPKNEATLYIPIPLPACSASSNHENI